MPTPLPVERDEHGDFAGVLTIRLEQPGKPVVVLDLDLLQRLEATLASLPDRGGGGVVIASASDRVFVAGADLKTISEHTDDQLLRYLEFGARVFSMIAEIPGPTAAAINGAALGGGLELAMHADALIAAPAAKPYPVGLPEAGLGLCPGWGGTNLLPARMDPAEAIRRTAVGKTLSYDEAAAAGLFDALAPSSADLLATAKRWVVAHRGVRTKRDGAPSRWIGRPEVAHRALAALDAVRPDLPPTPAAAAVAACVDEGLARGWSAATASERRELTRLRHTPESIEALRAFFARSSGPKP